MPDEAPVPPPASEPETIASVSARLSSLESAVASLGAVSVTQNHDGLARFRAWLSSFLVRP